MKKKFKKYPKRVWINQPSTLQPFHKLHGKVGIAVDNTDNDNTVTVCFTEGNLQSTIVPVNAISDKNSQANIFKYEDINSQANIFKYEDINTHNKYPVTIGSLFYHPCSIDIMEYKVISICQFEGFNHFILKATHNIGACGKIEIIIDNHNDKFNFVDFLDESKVEYSSGLKDMVEGKYYKTKEEAEIEFYKIQRTIALSNLNNKKRLYQEAEKRYNQINLIIEQIRDGKKIKER